MAMVPKFRKGNTEQFERQQGSTFLPSIMSIDERHDLARSLLSEFGVTSVNKRGYELIHSCCLPLGGHKNGDANPSASLNFEKMVYSCFGCGNSGGILWFIGLCRNDSPEKIAEWLRDQTELTDDVESVSKLITFIEKTLRGDVSGTATEPMPKLDRAVLTPWLALHPWLIETRRIPVQTAMDFLVGYGTLTVRDQTGELVESERIVIPHIWKGELRGWQSRRLRDDGTAKYLNTPGFPKDTSVYNGDITTRDALVVESPMSVLSKHHLSPNLKATFGAKVTPLQVDVLSKSDSVTLWMDNDSAGWKATHDTAEALERHCPVWVIDSPYAADPADLDDDTYLDLLENARVPYPLWKPPSSLLQWGQSN